MFSSIIKRLFSQQPILKNKDFVHLWTGQLFSQIANNSLLFVMALRIYQNTGSNTAVATLFMVYGIPSIILGVTAGAIVDKINAKTVLLTCDFSRVFLTLLFLILPHNLIVIYVIALLNAVISQFYVPAEAPSIPKLVSADLIVSANSFFAFTYYSSLAFGSLTAGPLIRIFGNYGVFAFISLLFLLAATRVRLLPSAKFHADRRISILLKNISIKSAYKVIEGVKNSLTYIGKRKILIDSMILLMGTQIIFSILGTLGPGFADKVMLIDVRDASLYIVGPAIVGIVSGALLIGRISNFFNEKKFINIGLKGISLSLILIPIIIFIIENLLKGSVFIFDLLRVILGLIFFLVGFFNAFVDIPANSNIQKETDDSMRGHVYGMLASFVGGFGILPVMFGGIIADILGITNVVLVLGVCVLLYSLIRNKLILKLISYI